MVGSVDYRPLTYLIFKGAEEGFSAPIPPTKTGVHCFSMSDGHRGRIWLSDRKKRTGEEVYWRVNIADAIRLAPPIKEVLSHVTTPVDILGGRQRGHCQLRKAILDAELAPRMRGFWVRLCLEDEAPEIGCGLRVVLCQFRGKRVVLHHADYMATIKRDVFKALVAANKRYRKRNKLKPSLRLVVSNPPLALDQVRDAA